MAAAHPNVDPRHYCVPGHLKQLSQVFRCVVEHFGGALPRQTLSAEQAKGRADLEEAAAAPFRRRVPFPREMVDIVSLGQPIDGDTSLSALRLHLTDLTVSLTDAYEWLVRYGYLPRQQSTAKENDTCPTTRPIMTASSS